MTQQAKRTIPIFLLLVLLVLSPLEATATASYTPAGSIYLQMSPGIFTHPAMFGAKLGRLEVTFDQPIYNPTILITGIPNSYNVVLIGPHRWNPLDGFDMNKKINMNVLAVSYPNGLGGPVFIRAVKDKQPLLSGWSGMQVTNSPFIIDLYLVNSNDRGGTTDPTQAPNLNTSGGEFKFDSPYVFENPPFSPHFTVGITDDINQGPHVFPESGDPTQGEFIPIDEQVGQGTTPVVDPGGFTSGEEDGGFWYGDGPPLPVDFIFTFFENSVPFALAEAYGSSRKQINTAKMEVINGVEGQTYKQKLTFTDSGSVNSFQLKHADSNNTIAYNLYFGTNNSLVPYGQEILWESLTPGINTKNLWIGGINEQQVAQKLSGSYSDTIIVNITAADN